jgi:hypothetical protein
MHSKTVSSPSSLPSITDAVRQKIEEREAKQPEGATATRPRARKRAKMEIPQAAPDGGLHESKGSAESTSKSKKEPVGKARKIRLYPTGNVLQHLHDWFGAARWTYNRCLEAVKKGVPLNKKALREHCVNQSFIDAHPEFKWLNDTPYDIRDEGMNDLLKAYKFCFSKGEKFEIRFRSKKKTSCEALEENERVSER